MCKTDRLRDEYHLDSPLKEAVDAVCAEPVPNELVFRVQERAKQLASASDSPRVLSPKARDSWASGPQRYLLTAVSASVLLMIVVLWSQASRSVLADVVEAAAQQEWIRFRGVVGPGRTDYESWYSPSRGIVAIRQGNERTFLSADRKVNEFYAEPGSGRPTLTRLPMPVKWQKMLASMNRFTEALLVGNPLQAFDGQQRELVRHEQTTIREGRVELVEHTLTQMSGEGDPSITVLRVDAESRLPVSLNVTVGTERLLDCTIDFPEQGPGSIYAMGVPPDVTIVDQTPGDDLQEIVEDWTTGRTQFDDYRAVVVQSSSPDHRARGMMVTQVWRKGRKWRVEQLRMPPQDGDSRRTDEVPEGVDPHDWWLRRGTVWETLPRSVSDGTTEILVRPVPAEPRQEDPDNSRYLLVESLKAKQGRAFQTSESDPRPDDIHVMPEFYTYPFLFGSGVPGFDITLLPDSPEGPPGTRLIESLDLNPSELVGRIKGARYWVDTRHGNAVTQIQWLKTGTDSDSKQGTVQLQSPALTPRGFWYPQIVREFQNSVSLDTGERSDTYHRFYVDFDVEIPDKLFDVHQWGTIQ